jgi:HAD superfamily hydrolase (TIGR01509 family)
LTPKVIIYDCDGVLVDSRRANAAYYNHILEHFGLSPLTPAQLDFVQVSTASAAMAYLFQGTPWLEQAREYEQTLDNGPFLPLLRLEPQVREVLALLRRHCRLAVASNRNKSLSLVLRTLELAEFFDLTVTSGEVSRPKPDPECLTKILSHFGVAPPEALYIGDAQVDGLTAERAGVPFAAYKNPPLPARFHLRDHWDLVRLLFLEPCRVN